MPDAWNEPDVGLVTLVSTRTPGRALDVGCAGGHDALWLARQGWAVTAIDTSRHAVSRVRSRAREAGLDVTALTQDVIELDAPGAFDLVSVCYMHLPAAARAGMLASASKALAPGGVLLFRSFDAGMDEAPFDRSLLPTRGAVLAELDDELTVQRADVADEFFPYMKKDMKLLTIIAVRAEEASRV